MRTYWTYCWLCFVESVCCVLRYAVLYAIVLWSDAAVPKSEVPEKTQREIASFCFNQEDKLKLPKTEEDSKETSNVRAPTCSGVVPLFPLEMEPECGKYRWDYLDAVP